MNTAPKVELHDNSTTHKTSLHQLTDQKKKKKTYPFQHYIRINKNGFTVHHLFKSIARTP